MRRLSVTVLALVAALGMPAAVQAHPERDTSFPDPSRGSVPAARTSGPSQVVCKPDSGRRIERLFGVRAAQRGRARRAPAFTGQYRAPARRLSRAQLRRRGEVRLRLLRRCRHRHIQAAVDAARNGERILVLPGVYREEPSRRVPYVGPEQDREAADDNDGLDNLLPLGFLTPRTMLGAVRAAGSPPSVDGTVAQRRSGICSDMRAFETPDDGDPPVPNYRFQYECRNSRNLVAVIGDSNFDGRCDVKCNLQIEGMGRRPTDVLVVGDRVKRDVIRGDRADGLVIKNLAAEQAAFNNVDVVETNGFRLDELETRYGQNYGVLTFASDHGLYEDIEAFGNGDSGIYPGSGPEGRCGRYGIEIRRVDSHDNVLGYSGTAGNGTFTHDSRFHDNSAGISTDSFASGHPGMPQDCSRWSNNQINSNNRNFFKAERQDYCAKTPFEKRPREIVCPQFQVPVGSGIIMYGANQNLVQDNLIWDNWRSGTRLFYVPAAVRGEPEREKQTDTSNGNRYEGNGMGVRPDGTRDPNGVDFFWDEQGAGNCWTRNAGPGGATPSSDPPPPLLPDCPGSPLQRPPNPAKSAQEVPCATWDPGSNPRPPGCTWFDTPPEPR